MALYRKKPYLKEIREEDGRLVYTGDVFHILQKNGKPGAGRLLAAGVLSAAAVILSGCLDTAGAADAFYVILPYIGEVCALFALLWNLLKLAMEKGHVRAFVREAAQGRIPGAAKLLALFALIGCVMSAVYLFRSGLGDKAVKSIAYPALKAVTCVMALYYDKLFRSVIWEKEN